MNVGAAGGAMIFFMLMVGMIIVGLYAVAYISHIFLVTVDSTSTGYDEVAWPDEPLLDWLWKGAYLVWLTAIWLIPLLFVGKHLAATHSADTALTTFLYVAVALFWLVFPISLMSSMSASSRWIIFSPGLVPRLFERFDALIGFYLVTGPIFALIAVGMLLLIHAGNIFLAPVGALIVAAGILIYARIFGRFALQIRYTKDRSPKPPPAPRRPARARARARAHDPWGPLGEIVQPSEMPPTDAPDPEARTGYDVRLDHGPGPAPDPPPRNLVDGEADPYEIADGPAHVDPPIGPMPERIVKPSQYEMELARKGKSPKPTNNPWTDGTFAFPLREANRSVMMWMTVLLFGFGFFFRLMMDNRPG